MNSSVELTLDRCVQRLRRRVIAENEQGIQSGTTEKSIDRTPSFYTSRSIVNLSGLSVSDPVPDSNKNQKKPYNVIRKEFLNDCYGRDDTLILNVPSDDIPLAYDGGRYAYEQSNDVDQSFQTDHFPPNRHRRRSNSNPTHVQYLKNTGTSLVSVDSNPGLFLSEGFDDDDVSGMTQSMNTAGSVDKVKK